MLTTLYVLVSYSLFDWSCPRSKTDLVNKLGDIVKEQFGLVSDLSVSSPFYKGATKVYNLTRKKKNVKHPQLAPPKAKSVRAAPCDAKEIITRLPNTVQS